MRQIAVIFRVLCINLFALAAISSLAACAVQTPTPQPTATATLAPTPTPTPQPDPEILQVTVVIPFRRGVGETPSKWRDLITKLSQSYARIEGVAADVRFYGDHEFGNHIDREIKHSDVIWWLSEGGTWVDTMEQLDSIAKSRSEQLYSNSEDVLDWIADGGVLIYSGNVHPSGFYRDFFPFRIGFEFHEVRGQSYLKRTTLTRAGWRALGADNSWPEYIDASEARIKSGDYIATYENLAGNWEVWGLTSGRPSIVAANYGDGWIILSQTKFTAATFSKEIVVGLFEAAVNRIDGKVPQDSARPPRVTTRAVEEVNRILEDADSGAITESQAQSALNEISNTIGKPALTWIVSNTPVFDRRTQHFVRFEDYAQGLASPDDPENPSRFEADPVGTAVDLFFGDADRDDIVDWFGLDDK